MYRRIRVRDIEPYIEVFPFRWSEARQSGADSSLEQDECQSSTLRIWLRNTEDGA